MRKKLIKIFIIELIMVAIIFLYFFFSNNMHNNSVPNTLTINAYDKPVEVAITKSKFYIELENGLLEGKEQIDLKDMSLFKNPKEIFSILETISNDNPEVMYYKGAEYNFGKIKLFYSKSKEEITKHQKEVSAIRKEFISDYISPEMSDYEKILTIHDYIINNSKYDERLITEGLVPPESYSSYGILSLGLGVCEGYAKTMKYLLDGVEIESMIVIGESKGENHAWNLVKIENKYYHIDPTWDDPVTKDGSDVLRYNFFNLNDEEISKSHTWNRDDYPSADSGKYNYFNYNSLVVNGKDELQKKLRKSLLNRESKLLVKIGNFSSEDIILNNMIESIVYENYKLIKLKSYSYSLDEDHGIIDFQFFYH